MNKSIEKITDLDAAPKCRLEFYGGNIILSATHNREKDKVFVIDGTTNMIKWEDTIGDMTLLYNSDFIRVKDSVYYIKDTGDREELLQVDINSGSIIDCISIPFGTASNYLRLSGENILICGKSFYYVFDTVNRRFDKIIVNSGDLGYSSLINKDNMVFHHNGGIYYYSIQDNMQQKLYDLKGKELFMMYGNTTWSILITADNVKKSLANDTCFDLIAIKAQK